MMNDDFSGWQLNYVYKTKTQHKNLISKTFMKPNQF